MAPSHRVALYRSRHLINNGRALPPPPVFDCEVINDALRQQTFTRHDMLRAICAASVPLLTAAVLAVQRHPRERVRPRALTCEYTLLWSQARRKYKDHFDMNIKIKRFLRFRSEWYTGTHFVPGTVSGPADKETPNLSKT